MVVNIFSLSHYVFKCPFGQIYNFGLCGSGLVDRQDTIQDHFWNFSHFKYNVIDLSAIDWDHCIVG